jgi:G:T/U-mismatch repair DNA glycosylase
MVRMMILQNPQQMDSYMNTKDKVKEIFSKHYDTALAPFFDAKKARMEAEADRLNRNMKDYNCRAVLDIKENEAAYIPVIGGFFPRAKTTYCKSRKKCKFYISDADGILKMACECGHAIREHQYKLKEN